MFANIDRYLNLTPLGTCFDEGKSGVKITYFIAHDFTEYAADCLISLARQKNVIFTLFNKCALGRFAIFFKRVQR